MKEEAVTSKMKKIRRQKQMTLKDMSRLTGFSISFLSQMERGISPVTLTSLKKISNALGIPVRDLFMEEDEEKNEYVHRDNDVQLQGLQRNYKKFTVLSGHFDQRKMEIFHLVMEPNFMDYEESSHEGEEFYYILKGKARFVIEGKEYTIGEGETIHFPSGKRHYMQNPENQELEMLCVLSPVIF